MTWTTPRTWADQELVTANLLNTHLRDNLIYLLPKIIGRQGHYMTGAYSTSSTTFVDVDATNLKVSGDLNGTTLICICGPLKLSYNAGSANAYEDLILDSTTRAGDPTNGLFSVSNVEAVTLVGVWTGLTPGTHDVKLQFRSQYSAPITIRGGCQVEMLLFEA